MSPDGQFILVVAHQAAVLAPRDRGRASRRTSRSGPARARWSARSATSRSAKACPIGGVNAGPRVVPLEPDRTGHRASGPRRSTAGIRRSRCRPATGCSRSRRRSPASRRSSRRPSSASAASRGPRRASRCSRESDRATRVTRTWLIDAPGAAPRKLWERKQQDRYADPGMPMMRPRQRRAILQVGDTIYLAGRRRLAAGRPPVPRSSQPEDARHRAGLPERRQELRDGRGAPLATMRSTLLTRWETKTDFPNYYVRDLARRHEARADAVQGPGAAAHGHPEAVRHLRPQGRREAVGHGLPAAGLQARHAAAVRPVGVPGASSPTPPRRARCRGRRTASRRSAARRTCSSSRRATA